MIRLIKENYVEILLTIMGGLWLLGYFFGD